VSPPTGGFFSFYNSTTVSVTDTVSFNHLTDGTSIYITRDLGGAKERYDKYKFDKMIYVVASQQDLHCKQFFKMLELMGYEWADRLQHINFGEFTDLGWDLSAVHANLHPMLGMVLGMSTRKGTVKFLDDILTDARESMHEQMQKNEAKYAQIEDPELTSDVIGMTAVKIQDMAARRCAT
jgi:arginyl-tRNA synthetase